ncbi:14-3-3-like protein GF14 kappa [Camellia sinensis]|uniref:14-3-3-like protein GF14 kappa n=1 Tax=Camellia sinensis TaxID=4442 RepID=UPI001036D1B2|nr:14-3-3-like protein GF14 kappa [Camellia sinensis]
MAKLAQPTATKIPSTSWKKLIIGSTSSSGSELTIEERNLLSTAPRNVMDSLRAAWRALSSTEQNHNNHVRTRSPTTNPRSNQNSSHICNRVLNLLEKHLIPSAYGQRA